MAERRRLPVLNRPAEPEREEERPPLHWVGFGTVAIFAAWLPLTYVAGAISARVMEGRFGKDASKDAVTLALGAMDAGERARLMAVVALPGLFALAMAAFGGGFVIGRFGDRTGTREAALAGGIAALIASAMAWAGATLSALVAATVTTLVAVGFAAWGGRTGSKRRAG